MKKLFTILLCGVCLCSCVTTKEKAPLKTNANSLYFQDGQRRGQALAMGAPYVSNNATIGLITSFSDDFGIWHSDGYIMNYELRIHGLGYSKKYKTFKNNEVYADVYSYHMRLPNLPNGIDSEIMEKIYKQTVQEIKSTKIYENIKMLDDKDTSFGNIPFKKYSYEAIRTEDGETVVSSMFLTIYKHAVFKVRITYSVSQVENGAEMVEDFMQELVNDLLG